MDWRRTLVLSVLLASGFLQFNSVAFPQHDKTGDLEANYTGGNGNSSSEGQGDGLEQRPHHTEANDNEPSDGTQRHECEASIEDHICIFRDVFIDNLNNSALFGHVNQQWNNQSRLYFERSRIRSLPRSLVDSFRNTVFLYLGGLQMETIERNALANGRTIRELYLSFNKIASLDADVFDGLESLERLDLFGNVLSSLPPGLFQYTRNLSWISLEGNQLQRIEDSTFRQNTKLWLVVATSNRITHFDLSMSQRQHVVCVTNNLLQELKISGNTTGLLASNNQIRSVIVQADPLIIRYLNLSHNKLNTTAWVKPFSKLRTLDLSFNEIEDISSTDFEQLPNLRKLKLNYNRLFTFDLLWSMNCSLRILDLSHNNLLYLDYNLNQLQQMEELYLDHNSLVTVNLETLGKLGNLTLSHNDWDCASLTNVTSGLPTETVVDYDTETHCEEHYKLERGLCCTVNDMPYHDRFIQFISLLYAHGKMARGNDRCTGDTMYANPHNMSSTIANPSSPTLQDLNEVHDLKSDVQRLEHRIDQARNQMEKDEGKIDELMRTYYRVTQWILQPSEKLRNVFDRLKQRDKFNVNETAVREGRKNDKEKEIDDMERQANQMKTELDGKTKNLSELQQQITEKIVEVKKLEAKKRKLMYKSNE